MRTGKGDLKLNQQLLAADTPWPDKGVSSSDITAALYEEIYKQCLNNGHDLRATTRKPVWVHRITLKTLSVKLGEFPMVIEVSAAPLTQQQAAWIGHDHLPPICPTVWGTLEEYQQAIRFQDSMQRSES